jgi:site-specific DNA-methyltransferase (cytosine-N4-specific)
MAQPLIRKRRISFICGDCRELLKRIPSNSIQCAVTSPPYWGLRDYGHKNQIGKEDKLETYIQELGRIFEEVKRVLKPTGVLWLNLGDGYTSGNRDYRDEDTKYPARFLKKRPRTPVGLKEKDLLGIPWRVAFMLQNGDWFLRNDIIWHKPNAMPESVKDRPNRNHEYVFLFTKSSNYYFRKASLKSNTEKTLRSVWTIINKGSKSTVHSATFPEELVKICLLTSTRANNLVIDPFMGVGTVGRVCSDLNRRFIGIELNKRYIKTAKNLLKVHKKTRLGRSKKIRAKSN